MISVSSRRAAACGVFALMVASAFSNGIEYSLRAEPAPSTAVESATTANATTDTSTSTPGATTLSPPPSIIEPQAQQALNQTVAAYAALKSFSANVKLSGTAEVPKVDAAIKWQQPNRFAISVTHGATSMRTVSDGKTLFRTFSDQPQQYLKVPLSVPLKTLPQALMNSDANDLILTGVNVMIATLKAPQMKSLVLSEGADPATQIVTAIVSNGLQNAVAPGSQAPESLSTFTMTIDKKDHLLRQVKVQLGGGPTVIEGTEIYSNVRANPLLPASTFVFVPQKGAKVVVPPPTPLNYDARLKIGVTPFAFQAKATNAQTVSIAKYKGRVLLLDFWATWCGPCVAEMPNVKATYAKYHAQGFDVLGISLDLEPKALSDFIKAQKIAWPQVYDTASKGKIANLYGVRAIPFAILIGRDGKIAAVDVRGEALESAVKSALAQK